ncbi:MAG: sigma 54-interacting transcriptional regulator, partial [Myxococcota bacterium]|nr:sigma 54-interacting transcriptional regulator [Myxococcota bacterium]
LHLQAKILRVLESRTIERVGGVRPIPVDVRIVSATHRDLGAMIREGTFREDLFYRLAVFPIQLPPLRMRHGDIPLLANHFVRRMAAEEGKTIDGFTSQAMQVLERHDYPGNVRELQNIVSRAVVVSTGPSISPADLPIAVGSSVVPTAVSDLGRAHQGEAGGAGQPISMSLARLFPDAGTLPTLEAVELELIRHTLELHRGNRVRAARSLGISRATLYRRLSRLEEVRGGGGEPPFELN